MHRHTRGLLATLAASLCASACGQEPVRPDALLSVEVSPLELDGVEDAVWDLRVLNGAETPQTVFAVRLTASRYGDGEGSVSYVGPCDAQVNDNTIELRLVGIYGSPIGSPGAFGEAAPAGALPVVDPGVMRQSKTCVPNADVFVAFDVTVMRPAGQGFFDIAVDLEDVFCSAKYDCDANPLLFDETGARGPTHVFGFACTAGPSASASTRLLLDQLVLDCGAAGQATIDPTAGDGNLCVAGQTDECEGVDDPSGLLYQAAIYSGTEALAGMDKRYWNAALGVRPMSAGPPVSQVYYTRQAGGASAVPFGTVALDGAQTELAQLDLPLTDSNPELTLIVAPDDGELWGFQRSGCCGETNSFGVIDPATGDFSVRGELQALGFDFMLNMAPVVGFTGNGRLLIYGFVGSSQFKLVEVDRATGAVTTILAPGVAPHDLSTSFAPGPGKTVYYVQQAGGTGPVPFGTLDADTGAMTPIGPGLELTADDINRELDLLTAPDGSIWAFNRSECCGDANSFGRIDPSTGTLTLIGDLQDAGFDRMGFMFAPPVVGFTGTGELLVFGFIGSSTHKFGRLDTTTGAFTEILGPNSANGVSYDFAFSFATPPRRPAATCTFRTRGTVDDGGLGTPASIAAGRVYPFIDWAVELADCPASFPLGSGDDAVSIRYTTTEATVPLAFGHSLGGPKTFQRVFVTAQAFNANLGGVDGADARCQAAAEAASLGGQWRAWLSVGTNDAATRLPQSVLPYYLLDGTKIADDWADLTDGNIDAPIDIDENGDEQQVIAWTNTLTNGTTRHLADADTCSGFTRSSGTRAAYGRAPSNDAIWTAWDHQACNMSANLYCFEI